MLKKALLCGVLVSVLCVNSVYAESSSTDSSNGSILTSTSSQNSTDTIDDEIQRFGKALDIVRKYYVEPLPDHKLFDNALHGLVDKLDPHSSYLSGDELRDLEDVTKGSFTGLGLEIMPSNGYLKVITPVDGSPAQKAGIKSGDFIVRIDDSFVKDMTMSEAVKKMRGSAGTSVYLTVVRNNQEKPLKFKLIREDIKIPSVKGKLLENDYGYIRLSAFQETTNKELKDAVETLQDKSNHQMKGLIIDLRNNPGGLLESAVDVADDFLDVSKNPKDNNLIVYTKGRAPDSDIKMYATPGDIVKGMPLVVLINEGSASGAEIVAGALQDHKRAVIVGTNSFGKGSVQTLIPLDANSAIKLTTALYYTPSGRSIQASGIHPDVVAKDIAFNGKAKIDSDEFIKESDLKGHLSQDDAHAGTLPDDASAAASEPALAKEDYQLFQALNVLKGIIAVRK